MSAQELLFMESAAVLGSGAFGTALSTVLARKAKRVKVWHMDAKQAAEINAHHENHLFLKGFPIPTNVEFSANLPEVLAGARIILFVVPTQFIRGFMKQHGDEIVKFLASNKASVLVCSKGIERGTLKFPTEIVAEYLPNQVISVLAGPSFATEISQRRSTSVCIASPDHTEAVNIQRLMTTPDHMFFCLTSTDVVGCEVASAMKNVVAIASGILGGQGMGNNARAALITRALLEIRDVTMALGGDGSAVFGLAGIGDLLLTSSSLLSRNYSVGKQLGEGKSFKEIMRNSKAVAEGTSTADSLHKILVKYKIHAPICNEVYEIIYKERDVHDALHHFLGTSTLAAEGLEPLRRSKL